MINIWFFFSFYWMYMPACVWSIVLSHLYAVLGLWKFHWLILIFAGCKQLNLLCRCSHPNFFWCNLATVHANIYSAENRNLFYSRDNLSHSLSFIGFGRIKTYTWWKVERFEHFIVLLGEESRKSTKPEGELRSQLDNTFGMSMEAEEDEAGTHCSCKIKGESYRNKW